jgi:hypothetical protein
VLEPGLPPHSKSRRYAKNAALRQKISKLSYQEFIDGSEYSKKEIWEVNLVDTSEDEDDESTESEGEEDDSPEEDNED